MSSPQLVQDCMTTDLLTVAPSDDIFEAVGKLLRYRVSGAPVVEDDNRLVGLISEKDCLTLFAAGLGEAIPEATVETFMTRDVKTLSPETTLFDVASQFLQEPYRRYPVVKDAILVGIVCRRDVLRALHDSRGPGRKIRLGR